MGVMLNTQGCPWRVTDIYFAVGDLVDGGVDLIGFEAREPAA